MRSRSSLILACVVLCGCVSPQSAPPSDAGFSVSTQVEQQSLLVQRIKASNDAVAANNNAIKKILPTLPDGKALWEPVDKIQSGSEAIGTSVIDLTASVAKVAASVDKIKTLEEQANAEDRAAHAKILNLFYGVVAIGMLAIVAGALMIWFGVRQLGIGMILGGGLSVILGIAVQKNFALIGDLGTWGLAIAGAVPLFFFVRSAWLARNRVLTTDAVIAALKGKMPQDEIDALVASIPTAQGKIITATLAKVPASANPPKPPPEAGQI